jgi:hypothetical protein
MQLLISSSKDKILPKYSTHRSEIKNGDVILFHGTSMMSKAIQYFDEAYFNHSGIVWIPEKSDRVLTLDMWQQGLACLPLSRRMSGYSDFCVIRPKVDSAVIDQAIKTALGLWDGRDVGYNYGLLLRIAMIKKTGIDLTGLGKKNNFICSGFTQYFISLLGLHTYENVKLITPEDFMRFIDENFEILFYK